MPGNLIHANLISGARARIKTVQLATTGLLATLSAAGNIITRSSGSFVTDGFGIGDEIMATGFANSGNSGRTRIMDMTATTLTLEKALVTEVAGGSRSIIAGLPQGRAWEGEDYSPIIGQPFVSETNNILPSFAAAIGFNATEGHAIQFIWTLFYPSDTGSLAVRRMAGAIRSHFRPGVSLFYGGQGGTILAASVSGRLVKQPHWLNVTVTANVSARTTG